MNIDIDYTVDFTKELLNIPSPSGFTQKAIKRVEEEFKKFNIKYEYTKKGAIIGRIEGEDKKYNKMISAHIDTLGAVVKKIKPNGRLELVNIGGFNWGAFEGENLLVHTIDGKQYDGTLLPVHVSVHVYPNLPSKELERKSDNMEVRLDEDVSSDEDVRKLGICQGDFISFETKTKVTKSGFFKSRFLDDKLCIAQIFSYIKYLQKNNKKPKTNLDIYISNYEEIGHGISKIPEYVDEFISLDIGLVAFEDAHGSEKHVSIAAKDSRSPYDYETRQKMQKIADENNIGYTVGVYNGYGSDATASVGNGFDVKFACFGPSVDASHHYERCHMDGIKETIKLMICYL